MRSHTHPEYEDHLGRDLHSSKPSRQPRSHLRSQCRWTLLELLRANSVFQQRPSECLDLFTNIILNKFSFEIHFGKFFFFFFGFVSKLVPFIYVFKNLFTDGRRGDKVLKEISCGYLSGLAKEAPLAPVAPACPLCGQPMEAALAIGLQSLQEA